MNTKPTKVQALTKVPRPGEWLLGTITPWWRDHIVDPDGGYFEAVDAEGAVVRDSRRTTLTQARLMYSFSHAAVLTGDGSMLQAAMHGRAFLEGHCLNHGNGGWWRAVDQHNGIADPVHDAYDHAFVLFALAWHFRATGDNSCRTLAYRTCEFMSAQLADKECGGFFEEFGKGPKPQPPHRRQNPHMHLLEAYLAWHTADPDGPWLGYGASIIELFQRFFFDPATGTLVEYFNRVWTPAEGREGQWREPGHHFEWIWLLHQYQRCAGLPPSDPYSELLWEFATEFGVEHDTQPLDLAFDGVDSGGRLLVDTKLLWPQTELIKACAARVEMHGDDFARSLANGRRLDKRQRK